eukprot:4340080-Pyramimonas_sp.AAC.1
MLIDPFGILVKDLMEKHIVTRQPPVVVATTAAKVDAKNNPVPLLAHMATVCNGERQTEPPEPKYGELPDVVLNELKQTVGLEIARLRTTD